MDSVSRHERTIRQVPQKTPGELHHAVMHARIRCGQAYRLATSHMLSLSGK